MLAFFTTFIEQPLFNLLVLIYALIPYHNFGLAIIIFTAIIRLLLWPLVRKQLHQTKAMRKLQPELKRIKKETKGDRQKESTMVMALYKEHGVSPFGSIGILILQLPILIALYSSLRRVVGNPHQIVSFAYPALQHLPWMVHLSHNIHDFDATLFGVVNLTRVAVGSPGIYLPAMALALGSAVVQYFQSKQLLVTDKNMRKLRDILRDASSGKQADQSEITSAVNGSTRYFIPVLVFIVYIRLASALSLYWFVGGLIAYGQQSLALREDETQLESLADGVKERDVDSIPEAEVVETEPKAQNFSVKTKKQKRKKRRRR
ncbi:MAG: YidC/Oxa1 family membrane protein insertase [Candidatus Saccharimonadales bacterium]